VVVLEPSAVVVVLEPPAVLVALGPPVGRAVTWLRDRAISP
jgi:hypothetical protein